MASAPSQNKAPSGQCSLGRPPSPRTALRSALGGLGFRSRKRLLHPHKVPFGRMVRLRAHQGPHGRPPNPLAMGI